MIVVVVITIIYALFNLKYIILNTLRILIIIYILLSHYT